MLTSDLPRVAGTSARHSRTSGGKLTELSFSLVVLFALAVFSRHVGRPGLWRDEAATIIACRRSLGQLFAMSGNIDLVHLPYYLVARIGWQLDNSVTAVRLISVIAMSLTAGMLVLIGRRLGSVRVGTLAGVLLAVNPFASRYAQEARPFATAALLATISTYLLLGLLHKPTPGRRLAYASSVVLVGLFNVLALMIVLPHAVQVWWSGDRPVRRRWAIVTATALATVSPFVLATFTQRGQVSWIESPHLYDLRSLLTIQFGSRLAPIAVVVAVLAVLGVRYLLARSGPASGWASAPAKRAFVLGIGWTVLPTVLLFSVSLVLPMWDIHYLLFTVPGLALLLAGLCPSLDGEHRLRSWAAASTAVLLIAALGLNQQIAYRAPVTGHEEDFLLASARLGERVQAGDAVLFVPSELRMMSEVSAASFAGLDDVAMDQTPIEAANLVGTPVDPADLADVLLPHKRVWLIEGLFTHEIVPGSVDDRSLTLLAEQFDEAETQTITDLRIRLFVRT